MVALGNVQGALAVDSGSRPLDTGPMGVRTRVLDIKAGAAKPKADRVARLEAELVIDRWNRRLATGRDLLWSPTIRAALIAGTPWLDVAWAAGQAAPSDSRPASAGSVDKLVPGCGVRDVRDRRPIAKARTKEVRRWLKPTSIRTIL
jgi:hypothetical protein